METVTSRQLLTHELVDPELCDPLVSRAIALGSSAVAELRTAQRRRRAPSRLDGAAGGYRFIRIQAPPTDLARKTVFFHI